MAKQEEQATNKSFIILTQELPSKKEVESQAQKDIKATENLAKLVEQRQQ